MKGDLSLYKTRFMRDKYENNMNKGDCSISKKQDLTQKLFHAHLSVRFT